MLYFWHFFVNCSHYSKLRISHHLIQQFTMQKFKYRVFVWYWWWWTAVMLHLKLRKPPRYVTSIDFCYWLMLFALLSPLSWTWKKPNQLALTTMPYTYMPVCQWCSFSCFTFLEQRVAVIYSVSKKDLERPDQSGCWCCKPNCIRVWLLTFSGTKPHECGFLYKLNTFFIHMKPGVPYFSLDASAGLWGLCRIFTFV